MNEYVERLDPFFIRADLGDVVISEPTMRLRWNGDILEQGFIFRKFVAGKNTDAWKEWRPIPTIDQTENSG